MITCDDRDKKENIVLLVKSIPLRNILMYYLRKAGINPIETINATDTIHYMAKNGLPDSFIVCDSLGDKKEAVRLLLNLQKLTKEKEIPSVIILTEKVNYLEKANIPKYIKPVKSLPSLLDLKDMVFDAHDMAKTHCSLDPSDNKSDQVQAALSKSAVVTEIDKALQMVEGVIKSVANNTLPGPAMPGLLQEVRSITNQRDITYKELGAFIRQHQSLALKMLTTVNSAFYSRGKKIETVEQAIATLGLKTTNSILQSVAALQYVVGKDKDLQDMIKGSLKKAYLVALLSQIVGKHEKFSDMDKVFSIALFHNLGTTFLLYTYSMLMDKGKVEKISRDSLNTIALKCTPNLNGVLCKNIELPNEIVQMYSSENFGSEAGKLIGILHKSMFLANCVLDDSGELKCCEGTDMEGLTEGLIEKFNSQYSDIQSLINSYV